MVRRERKKKGKDESEKAQENDGLKENVEDEEGGLADEETVAIETEGNRWHISGPKCCVKKILCSGR